MPSPSSAALPPAVPYRPAAALRRRSSTLRAAVWPQQAPPSPLRATSGRALRNAGLRRRAPAHLAVPRHQLISRRSRNATGTDDRAALAAQPRPGAQEGGGRSSGIIVVIAGPVVRSRRHDFFAKSKC